MASAELRTLHVANLTRNVRAAHLKEICEFWGPVSRVHLAVDSRAGLPRGFAYVEFSSPADADDCCVNLDGGKLDGNTITLTLTHDDFPSDAPAGAGAGGGSEHRSAAPAPWGGEDRRGGGGGWDREREAGRDERRREEGGRGGGGGSSRRSRSRSRSRERGERGRR